MKGCVFEWRRHNKEPTNFRVRLIEEWTKISGSGISSINEKFVQWGRFESLKHREVSGH